MAGLSAGSLVASRLGDRLRHPLRTYAALELLVGVVGVLLVYALPSMGRALAPVARNLWEYPALHHALRGGAAFTLLLVPSTAIGMTLPLLVRTARTWDPKFGRVLGLLYGMNTLGGVLGVLLVELWWLEALGIVGTALVAGGLEGVAALIAWGLVRNLGERRIAFVQAPEPADAVGKDPSSRPSLRSAPPGTARAPWLLAAFLSGFCILGLEVVWLRFLMLFLNDTPLAFSMILVLVLIGLALGGLIASLWMSRSGEAARYAPLVAFGVGVLALVSYRVFPAFASGALPARQGAWLISKLAAPLVLPACVASGVLFTLIGTGLRQVTGADAKAVGQAAFANSVGAGAGALAAGLWLLPAVGIEGSLLILFALPGVAGAALSFSVVERPALRYGSVAAFTGVLALFPFGMVDEEYFRIAASRWKRAGDEVVGIHEGLTSTLVHVVHEHAEEPLFDHVATNAYSMTANGFGARRYMKLFSYLPTALLPTVESALVIGFGIGNTAGALIEVPELERLDVVDVSPEMLDVSRQLALPLEPHPLDDPRTRVYVDDGRYFLQATSHHYDLITGEPPPPTVAGVSNLYTKEYFELVRERLGPGGMTSYWLPLSNITGKASRSIISAFCQAFADCSLWHGTHDDLVLLGSRDGRAEAVSDERFSAQWSRPETRKELVRLGFEVPAQLAALFIGDADYLASLIRSVDPLTDDHPRRLQASSSPAEGARLLDRIQNPAECRARFRDSAFIRSRVPEGVRAAALGYFDLQRLITELLSRSPKVSRDARTLHKILQGSDLELPVLLLLGSSPDYRRVVERLPEPARRAPEWRPHWAAKLLAERQLQRALGVVEDMAPGELPVPDVKGYLAYAIRRTSPSSTVSR